MLVLLVVPVLMISCKKKVVIPDDAFEYNRPINLAAPLINSKFTAVEMLEVLQDSTVQNPVMIKVDTGAIEKGLLYAEYKQPFDYKWDDVADMPSKNYSGSYDFDASLFTSTKSASKIVSTHAETIKDKIVVNGSPDQRFDMGKFSAGQVSVNVSGISALSGGYIVRFTNVTKDGQVLEIYGGNINQAFSGQADLAGYEINFSHNEPVRDSSFIDVEIVASGIGLSGTPFDPFNPPTKLDYSISLDNMSPDYLTGYFGKGTPMSDEFQMEFNIFEEMDFLDKVQFKEPRVYVDYKNYFGVPVTAKLVNASFKSSLPNAEDLTWGGEPISLGNANWNNGNGVLPYDGRIEINNQNSNLEEILNHYPYNITFNVEAKSNPDGENPSEPNFVTDRNEFDSELILMLPFWFRTDAYKRTDTAAFDVNELFKKPDNPDDFDPLDNIASVDIKFQFQNAFPFRLDLDIWAAYEDGSKYMNGGQLIANQEILKWSGITAGGAVDTTNVPNSDFIISLSGAKLEDFRKEDIKKLLIITTAETAGASTNSFVKLHDYNYTKTKVTVNIRSKSNN